MMTIEKHTDSFYVTGGTLRRDAACYVQRRADQALYDGLMQGKFCYVLTSRQMGKSSLMVRTAARLREEGVHVAVLDLTAIGQNLNAEQWYDGLLARVGQQFQLEDELEDAWLNHPRLSPLLRWMKAIREVVLPRLPGRIVIFVDEIDAVRSLPFSTDEFFAAIRELYNRRTEEAELERLTFCLLGVASPSDLIRDTRTTPFNIGQRIELNDFSDDEAEPLARGLGRKDKTATKLLKRILYWTGGHPYLTQRLCQAVAADAQIKDVGGIDRLCDALFFTTRARETDDNLLFVREQILRGEADKAALLDLYAQVRAQKRIRDDETNPLVTVLRLSGITRVVEGLLYVRNRIYYRVFDREWVLANLPDAEVQRQKAAYRRGVMRTATIAAAMLAVVGGLAMLAFWQRNRAVQSEKTKQELLYTAQMNVAE
ncbi:MAG TPA: AAA-like domain-containing protein, partial [Blastocatellia bacterium]|nr:AAA-like domain-containing protein [Blastocatellia bacterium]